MRRAPLWYGLGSGLFPTGLVINKATANLILALCARPAQLWSTQKSDDHRHQQNITCKCPGLWASEFGYPGAPRAVDPCRTPRPHEDSHNIVAVYKIKNQKKTALQI